jgi:tetratricopeptide (TPR) repeat protein
LGEGSAVDGTEDKPATAPTQNALEFLREAIQLIEEAWEDAAPVYQFFRDNLAKLNDETLLHALPLLFEEQIAQASSETQWSVAATFGNFGNLVEDFPLGNRALNIELSITVYQLALKVFVRETYPDAWATAQNNLGIAYSNRIRGNREENLEEAVAAYRLALQVYTREAYPEQWAMTQNNLGLAYSNRIRGERAENLEEAIAAYRLAFQVRTREAYPEKWAMTQNNLGVAYSQRIRGSRGKNLEEAIAAYHLALKIRAREAYPEQWAMTEHNLANAYRDRIQGNRTDNLDQAIHSYKQAAQIFTQESFPGKWAENQGNLVAALLERLQLTGEAADLDEAIAALEAARGVAVPGTDSYAFIHHTLGVALDYRYSLHHQPADLEQAIGAYRRAAETTPWKSDQTFCREKAADSEYQLGVALVQEGEWYNGLAHLEASSKAYRQIQNRLSMADALQQIARTHYLMGNFDKALIYFRDALRIYLAEANVPGEAACRAGLGRLLLRLNFVEDAISELNRACELYHQLDDEARLVEVKQVYELAQKVRERQPL